ncbi:MAG: DUF1638 domain-containing protein [Marinisporobacter sp.]|jgi:hypothetical protein|nr:DUF1638 domain-containing protein [Marinisporobacter sp.]
MRLKALICDVLSREFYYWASISEHVIDIELMSSDYHEYPKEMHKILQKRIDELEKMKDQYDYILIGFGLCGNVLEGLESRSIPMIIPRAHDCITLFMGSKETYEKYFRENTGTMYYIESWIDRNGLKKERKELESIGMDKSYEEYVEKYGEENAKYLIEIAEEWKNRYNKALYISSELNNNDFSKEVKKLAEERNWDYEEMKNNPDIIKKMVNGQWNEKQFLIVNQHSKIDHTTDILQLG